MKTLVIIRHGKSSWEDTSLSDRERPLLQKGIKRTEKIGHYLKKNNLKPDVFISSPATRAKQTADIIADIFAFNLKDILTEELFYFDGSKAIIDTILRFKKKWETVFIFGHNPDFTSVSKYFLPQDDLNYLPTTGTAILQFDTNHWKYISQNNCINSKVVFPRDL